MLGPGGASADDLLANLADKQQVGIGVHRDASPKADHADRRCGNTIRDVGSREAKCRDGFCPLGVLAPLSNVDNLTIITEINGREADSWHTGELQRNAAQLLSALSEFATLNPGDAILIGTPHSRVTLRPGDRVRILADGFPALENPVVAEGELA